VPTTRTLTSISNHKSKLITCRAGITRCAEDKLLATTSNTFSGNASLHHRRGSREDIPSGPGSGHGSYRLSREDGLRRQRLSRTRRNSVFGFERGSARRSSVQDDELVLDDTLSSQLDTRDSNLSIPELSLPVDEAPDTPSGAGEASTPSGARRSTMDPAQAVKLVDALTAALARAASGMQLSDISPIVEDTSSPIHGGRLIPASLSGAVHTPLFDDSPTDSERNDPTPHWDANSSHSCELAPLAAERVEASSVPDVSPLREGLAPVDEEQTSREASLSPDLPFVHARLSTGGGTELLKRSSGTSKQSTPSPSLGPRPSDSPFGNIAPQMGKSQTVGRRTRASVNMPPTSPRSPGAIAQPTRHLSLVALRRNSSTNFMATLHARTSAMRLAPDRGTEV
jgi:hypothetical protein